MFPLQIVNDVLVLYVAGEIDVQLAMEILDYLDNEGSPVVWESVLDGFEKFITEDAACNMNKYLYREWEVRNTYMYLCGDGLKVQSVNATIHVVVS